MELNVGSPAFRQRQLRLCVRCALDMLQASRGRWTPRDFVGVTQWIKPFEQDAVWRMYGPETAPVRLRNMAITGMGTQNLLIASGMSWGQLDVLQRALEREPEAVSQLLVNALDNNTSCVLDGVRFDLSEPAE